MKRTEQILQEAVQTQEVAGANLLVIKDGKEICYSEAGYADVDSGKKYTRDTIFRLYSMTKPITAAAAMLLMERGILDIGKPVEEILPGFAEQFVWEGNQKVPVRRKMVVKDLLSMTSGLTYGGDTGNMSSVKTQELFDEIDSKLYGEHPLGTVEIANRLGQCGLAFHPGDDWRYGTSADVLGAVIECVTGKSFGSVLREEFFEPLGMEDTGFYVPQEKQHRLASVYEQTAEGLKFCPTNHLGIMYTQEKAPAFESGGAGLVSTLDDYARFAEMLQNGGSWQGRQILSPATVDYFISGKLMPWQQESMWRGWDTLSGYSYGNLMRVMQEPGMAYFKTWKGEYGWDGWLGAYFCNSPLNKTTILLSYQKKDSGTIELTRKIRNVLGDL
jgi:CubicO group peptidase (beta-lactamase class C family)